MPYFCIACGTFQREVDSNCSSCGAKYEKATNVDLFSRVAKDLNESDSSDDLPDELVSRPLYFWYKTTRPWRKLWRRGFLWRIFLLSGASLVVGLPLATATIQIIKLRCDPYVDVTCVATVVHLVTPVSEEFYRRLTEPMSDDEIALSAEIYDAVMLLGLATVDDKVVSSREVIRISGGDFNICTSAKVCATEIQKGQDVDYDGVSGSVFLSPDGDRGTYLTNRLTHKKVNEEAGQLDDRLIGSLKSRWLDPDTTFSGSTISVISKRGGRSVSQAVMLAKNDLQDAGVKVQILRKVSQLDKIDSLGNLLVIVDRGYSDGILNSVGASNRIVISVGSEWRKTNTKPKILRISANLNLLAAAVAAELKTNGEILVVGRCGDQSPALASSLQQLMDSNQLISSVRTDCIITRSNLVATVSKNSPETLVVATSYNPIGLYRTLLETGYIGKTKNIILIGERIIRIPVSRSPSPNP